MSDQAGIDGELKLLGMGQSTQLLYVFDFLQHERDGCPERSCGRVGVTHVMNNSSQPQLVLVMPISVDI